MSSSLALTCSSAAPKRIGPWSMMILLASSASPLTRPSSINAWMVDDSRMAVIPPKQCLISSHENPTPAMTAADVHNSLISAVTAAGSTRSFRRSTMIGIWSSSRALKGARDNMPTPPYAQLKGSWSSMKNGKPLFHYVLQCVSCWKKELPDGDRRQGRRDYTKCPGTRSRGTRAGDRCYPTASKVHRRQLVADARPDSAQKTGRQGHRFPIHRCTVGPRRHFD